MTHYERTCGMGPVVWLVATVAVLFLIIETGPGRNARKARLPDKASPPYQYLYFGPRMPFYDRIEYAHSLEIYGRNKPQMTEREREERKEAIRFLEENGYGDGFVFRDDLGAVR